jgi:hypothetical protein
LRQQSQNSGNNTKNGNSSGSVGKPKCKLMAPCEAMGDLCDRKGRRATHTCSTCGKDMHIGGACCARFELDRRIQVCGRCEYNQDGAFASEEEPQEEEEEEEEELEVVAVVRSMQKAAPLSRDMLLESDEESDPDQPMPELVSKPARTKPAAVGRKPAPAAAPPAAATTVRKRSPNFANTEDVFITRAWCSATEDSRKGSGQKQQEFNKALYAKFVLLVDDYNDQQRTSFRIPIEQRTQKAIVDRFAKIKKVASQFAGIVARNKIKSGETKAQHMECCGMVFEETHKSKFIWMECYEALEECPKWNSHHDVGNTGDTTNVNGKRQSTGEPQQRACSTGKRTKAIADNVMRIMKETEPAMVSAPTLSGTTGALFQMTSHMTEQMNMAHWSEADKSAYFLMDAKEKGLQQKMRILLLEKQLAELDSPKVSSNNDSPNKDSPLMDSIDEDE